MQYRLSNDGPLIDTGDQVLDEAELNELNVDWDNICEENEFASYLAAHHGFSIVIPKDAPEPTPDTHVMVPIEEYDRLRKAAGELPQ